MPNSESLGHDLFSIPIDRGNVYDLSEFDCVWELCNFKLPTVARESAIGGYILTVPPRRGSTAQRRYETSEILY